MIMSERKSSIVRPILWAGTLAIGFGTVWAVVGAWLYSAIDGARQGAQGNTYEQLVVRSDGTPLIHSYRLDNMSISTYRDLSGREQKAPDFADVLQGMHLAGEHGKPGVFTDTLGWERRLEVFVNEREPGVLWYFVHDGRPEGAGYFVGYERESNRRVGFIGLLGFRSHPVPMEEWIPVAQLADDGLLAMELGAGLNLQYVILVWSTNDSARSTGSPTALGPYPIRKSHPARRPRHANGQDRFRGAGGD